MRRIIVNGHIIWVGTLGGQEQLDVLIKDLKESMDKKSIHVIIFKEGEKHNEMFDTQTFSINST